MKLKVDIGVYEGGNTVFVDVPGDVLNRQMASLAYDLAVKELDKLKETWTGDEEPYVVEMYGPEGQPFYDYMNQFYIYFDKDGNRR